MNKLLKTLIAPLTLVISLGAVAQAQTKTEEPRRKSSIAAESCLTGTSRKHGDAPVRCDPGHYV